MSTTAILNLPVAVGLDGSEWVPLVQGGTTRRAQSALIGAASTAAIPRGTAGYAIIGNGPSTPGTYQGFTQSNTNAATRTWQAKGGDIKSVKDFGAVGDGVTDDTAAIQAAINALKPGLGIGWFSVTHLLYFPCGNYVVTSPVSLYSGVCLVGEGQASIIQQGVGFNGSALILLQRATDTDYFFEGGLRNLGFACSGRVWAVKATAGVVIQSDFVSLFFNCGFAISLGTYTQSCFIDLVYSRGSLDQLLYLVGNNNSIGSLDKEGDTGSSADPYVLIANSAGNTIQNLLIEGTTSVNKTLVVFDTCTDMELIEFWNEPTLTNGYAIHITGSRDTYIHRIVIALLSSATKIKLDTSSNTHMDVVSIPNTVGGIGALIEADATSDVHIELLRNTRGTDNFVVANTLRPIQIERVYEPQVFTDGETLGISPIRELNWIAGANLAVNGSFEAGRYGWTFTSNPDSTEEYITSTIASGLMGHFLWSGTGTRQMHQSIAVPANVPVTLSAMVKLVSGSGWINPYADGVGVTAGTGYDRCSVGTGWQIATATFLPTSAGSLEVGFFFVNAIEAYIDEASVSFGIVGTPNLGRFQTIEIGGLTVTYAASAPVTGTWRQGSIVYNSGAAASGFVGWVCVVAGSPGTWKTFGAISA